MEAIFLLRHLMKKYREAYKDFHMVFIDIKKACNQVPKEAMLSVLQKNQIPLKYIKLLKICLTMF